jgi:predicted phosphodiesterase
LHAHTAGFQIFNPGSPTDRRSQPEHTMGLARVNGSSIRFEHVSLGP